jgi:hypothetical protein
MSQSEPSHSTAGQPGTGQPDVPDEAVEVLRAVWAADVQGGAELDEDCAPQKTCKNMRSVTFDGFGENGADLGSAWRDRLAREGKLSTSGQSIRDLVLGSSGTD